jgi:hypothetical protein
MRNEFLDEIGDTLFAVAMAAAIGLGAANLAIQVSKERAAFNADGGTQEVSHLARPQLSPDVGTTAGEKISPAGLNF